MDIKELRILLQKYYNGETTLKEEDILKKYFIENPDIDEEFQAEKEQFVMFDRAKKQEVPIKDFEKDLEKLIDNQKVIYPVFRSNKTWMKIAGVAASILIIFGIYNSIKYFTGKPEYKDTIDDPRIAYEETKNALLYISEKLNYGTKELNNISKLNSGVQKLNTVSRLDQGLGKLQLLSKLPEKEKSNNNNN
ncbi:MAG: hypothetical protein JSV22_12770 [Bacteroidales bacterium]|nr:MAG: hypothetical protein JSV22_12770 [Bacteroidales bacterium]